MFPLPMLCCQCGNSVLSVAAIEILDTVYSTLSLGGANTRGLRQADIVAPFVTLSCFCTSCSVAPALFLITANCQMDWWDCSCVCSWPGDSLRRRASLLKHSGFSLAQGSERLLHPALYTDLTISVFAAMNLAVQVTSLEDMRRFILEHSDFSRAQGNVTKHVNIVTQLSEEISRRNLMEVSSVSTLALGQWLFWTM